MHFGLRISIILTLIFLNGCIKANPDIFALSTVSTTFSLVSEVSNSASQLCLLPNEEKSISVVCHDRRISQIYYAIDNSSPKDWTQLTEQNGEAIGCRSGQFSLVIPKLSQINNQRLYLKGTNSSAEFEQASFPIQNILESSINLPVTNPYDIVAGRSVSLNLTGGRAPYFYSITTASGEPVGDSNIETANGNFTAPTNVGLYYVKLRDSACAPEIQLNLNVTAAPVDSSNAIKSTEVSVVTYSYTPTSSESPQFFINGTATSRNPGPLKYWLQIRVVAGGTKPRLYAMTEFIEASSGSKLFSNTNDLQDGVYYNTVLFIEDSMGEKSELIESEPWLVDLTPPVFSSTITLNIDNSNGANAVLNETPKISWDSPATEDKSGIKKYQARIRKKLNNELVSQEWYSIENSSKISNLNLIEGQQYKLEIQAINGAGTPSDSLFSPEWTARATNDCINLSPEIGTACRDMDEAIFAGHFDPDGDSSEFQKQKYILMPSCDTSSSGASCTVPTQIVTRTWNVNSLQPLETISDILSLADPFDLDLKSGAFNTSKIYSTAISYLNQEPTASASQSAAMLCTELSFGGYDDWHLPTKSELAYLFCNSELPVGHNYNSANGFPQEAPCIGNGPTGKIKGWKSDYYITSSQKNDSYGWYQLFSTGAQVPQLKNNAANVRCIRTF
jgi:hypothetical protein